MLPEIKGFYDPATSTVSYVVYETNGCACAIIDPVLDYDASAARISTHSADLIAEFVQAQGLTVQWLLETHAHADHLSASAYLKQKLGGQIGIGAPITHVQRVFRDIYNLEPEFRQDGSQFDKLFKADDVFYIGTLEVRALHVPGHTPADMAYQIEGNSIFVGDTLFMPDVGTARADFPGGNAHTLYQSVQRLLALPPDTQMYVCHDYPPNNRAPAWLTTVAAQKAHNIHVKDGTTEEAFVAMRTARDATLEMPTLIIPSIQINVRAGQLPPPEDNGQTYLKIPLNVLG